MDTTSIYNTHFATLKLNFPVNYWTANFKNMEKRYRYCMIETYYNDYIINTGRNMHIVAL